MRLLLAFGIYAVSTVPVAMFLGRMFRHSPRPTPPADDLFDLAAGVGGVDHTRPDLTELRRQRLISYDVEDAANAWVYAHLGDEEPWRLWEAEYRTRGIK